MPSVAVNETDSDMEVSMTTLGSYVKVRTLLIGGGA